MLRTALKPRWLALLVVMLLAASAMAKLGEWQLERARSHGESAEQAEQAQRSSTTTPLAEVIRASETFPKTALNKKITATGHWDAENQLLVADRELDGRSGLWVLTPLITADGTTVPVVRGWVPSAGDAAAAAPSDDTEVTVTGLLEPGEAPASRAPGETSGLPDGQIDRVAVAQLAALWPQPMITGFVVLDGESPASQNAPAQVPPPTSDGALDWGNLSYAIQWWAFAVIALLFWFRLVRDDHRGLLRRHDEDEDDADGEDAEDDDAADESVTGDAGATRGAVVGVRET
ncbi:SURF1 family protein [Kineosporia sp. J2-2]|uniref:SURF1-like protein n=1 Tax=Kineosporia corallincola TaxID=2835133 RepID=A0ABS5TA41_9ACTN|nr:SURF1 family protein [Kineosporia corallincola]MBT0767910.1 SURF1 family protein [Kineosporia corallincola]